LPTLSDELGCVATVFVGLVVVASGVAVPVVAEPAFVSVVESAVELVI
jgi:hypothetical protein